MPRKGSCTLASRLAGGLLLDTHVAIWLVEQALSRDLIEDIAEAAVTGSAMVSPISAWEIGLLSRRSGAKGAFAFDGGPLAWFDRLVTGLVDLAPFTPTMAIGATLLPDWTHKDPADRLLVATARELNATLMTRDDEILRYARRGHLQAIAC